MKSAEETFNEDFLDIKECENFSRHPSILIKFWWGICEVFIFGFLKICQEFADMTTRWAVSWEYYKHEATLQQDDWVDHILTPKVLFISVCYYILIEIVSNIQGTALMVWNTTNQYEASQDKPIYNITLL